MLAVWTPAEIPFGLEIGGLTVDAGSPTHYLSVLYSAFDALGENPQGLEVEDENGDFWTIASTQHEPGDPELRLYVHPVAARRGQRLFDEGDRAYHLKVTSTDVYPTGVIRVVYAIAEAPVS